MLIAVTVIGQTVPDPMYLNDKYVRCAPFENAVVNSIEFFGNGSMELVRRREEARPQKYECVYGAQKIGNYIQVTVGGADCNALVRSFPNTLDYTFLIMRVIETSAGRRLVVMQKEDRVFYRLPFPPKC
ncbi:hypothetical protein FOL47_009471 [Perkinsus chesapeaki]|uniref:Uncharacterized protein n=1 Tax=Perkinsus chesapeaki TaxID=330153 RepID=A0A7J6L868_PERCH|nr:hypothetical protein FOL47_009471 [Perkinsus chesapeaki]